jgi:tRNA pseudouridine55 synthase
VDKPAGPSSFAVVRDLRARTGARAGHAGTLDPFATGLLVVLLGRSTKLAQQFVGLDKRYLTEINLSGRTSTGDPEGARVDKRDPPSREELESRLSALRGEVELRVPAASAVKIGGERAYRRHRRGENVEMPIRRSTIHSLELVDYDSGVATLDLLVASGTYVRSIADELGGHCRTLRRTEVGPFRVENADPTTIIPPEEAVAAL